MCYNLGGRIELQVLGLGLYTTLGLTLDYNTRDILSLSQTLAPVSLSTLHRRNNGSQDGTKPSYA